MCRAVVHLLLSTFYIYISIDIGQAIAATLEPRTEAQDTFSIDTDEHLRSGLKKGMKEVDFWIGAGPGMKVFGSEQAHDMVLTGINYGWILLDRTAGDKWYQGNWELLLELLGGAQFEPQNRHIIGASPLARYNFTGNERLRPFLNVGAGIAETDIGEPDLSTRFEFILQAGGGVHYFLTSNKALTLQYRFLHLSNAGIDSPNLGVNTSLFTIGISCFLGD